MYLHEIFPMFVYHLQEVQLQEDLRFTKKSLQELTTVQVRIEPFLGKAYNIYGLTQDCSNSSALAIVLLQSCTKASI